MIESANLDSSTFMKLLVTELQNQNPMEPMSNTEMMGQISQMATVEGINRLDGKFSDVLSVVRMTGGTEMVGSEVEYRAPEGVRRGTVESASVEDGSLTLRVEGNEVNVHDVLTLV